MIELKATNLPKWEADVGRFDSQLTGPIWSRVSIDILNSFQKESKRLFQSQGSAGAHGTWPQLSEAYRAWKERHFPGRPIMVLTGRGRASLTSDSEDALFQSSRLGGNWRIRVGSKLEYLRYHQEGVKTKQGVKVRRTIDPSQKIRREWIRLVHREIVKTAKRYKTLFETAAEMV